jgi:putative ubiquitin-RnfH superfamily antitoxin RatB of RatAB toxin-antitoxin module
MEKNNITVEVVYASIHKQAIISVQISGRSTVFNAITQSGILSKFPEVDLNKNKVGIFSKIVALDHQIEDGDRIEIYRSLQVDPKEARRFRAKKKLK